MIILGCTAGLKKKGHIHLKSKDKHVLKGPGNVLLEEGGITFDQSEQSHQHKTHTRGFGGQNQESKIQKGKFYRFVTT